MLDWIQNLLLSIQAPIQVVGTAVGGICVGLFFAMTQIAKIIKGTSYAGFNKPFWIFPNGYYDILELLLAGLGIGFCFATLLIPGTRTFGMSDTSVINLLGIYYILGLISWLVAELLFFIQKAKISALVKIIPISMFGLSTLLSYFTGRSISLGINFGLTLLFIYKVIKDFVRTQGFTP